MIMIPAFMQRQLLEQGGVGGVHSPEPLYSSAPSSLAASTLILSGVKSSQTAQSAEQSADMTADAIAMKRGNKNKRKHSKTIQKKPARMKGRPAAVIAEESSRGMPASDREELNTFLQKHSLHAPAIQIDLPTKVPSWGSAELFEGDCILFSALVCSTCEPSWSSLTHPLSDTLFIVMSWGKGKKKHRKLKNQLLQGGAAKCLWL